MFKKIPGSLYKISLDGKMVGIDEKVGTIDIAWIDGAVAAFPNRSGQQTIVASQAAFDPFIGIAPINGVLWRARLIEKGLDQRANGVACGAVEELDELPNL